MDEYKYPAIFVNWKNLFKIGLFVFLAYANLTSE